MLRDLGRVGVSATNGAGPATRVLMTEDVPSYGVLAAVRGLRAAGHEPWVAVVGRGAYTGRSRAPGGFVRVGDPALDPAAYADQLAEAAGAIGAVAVLPGTERAIMALTGRTGRFPAGVSVGVCEARAIDRATDKSKLVRLGRASRLRSPETFEVRRGTPVDFDDFEYPVIVKTPQKVTPGPDGRLVTTGAERVADSRELHELIAASDAESFLVQPFVSTQLEAICGVAWRGRLVCALHQVADRIYPPEAGVSASAHTVVADQDLRARVSRLIELIGWSGVFEIQVLRSGRRHYVIDFNPHMYGSIGLAIGAGLNLPAIWLDCLLGSQPECGEYRVGVRYRCEERDAGALMAAAARSDWRTVADGVVPHRGTVHAVFARGDPLPVLNSFRHVRRLRPLVGQRMRRLRAPDGA